MPAIFVVGSAGDILSTGAASAAGALGGIGGGGCQAANGAAGGGGGGGSVMGIAAAAAAGNPVTRVSDMSGGRVDLKNKLPPPSCYIVYF